MAIQAIKIPLLSLFQTLRVILACVVSFFTMSWAEKQTIVIDNGTGYVIKMQ
jgi:hypothetical protein